MNNGNRTIDTTANPSAAPIAGGATTFGSLFGGRSLQATVLKMIARLGRHMTGFAYRRLAMLEGHGPRMGAAGRPNRAAGGPGPMHEIPVH